ncbi:hypothetical protein [Streptomyces sp. NBC_00158]
MLAGPGELCAGSALSGWSTDEAADATAELTDTAVGMTVRRLMNWS